MTRNKPALLTFLTLVVLSSCTKVDNEIAFDNQGKMYFYEYEVRKFALKHNYGMMIFYQRIFGIYMLRYEFYDQNQGIIVRTKRREVLFDQIAKIPSGEILDLYDTCTQSTYEGFKNFDPSFFEELNIICQQKKIKLIYPWKDSYDNVLCTCQGE